MELTIFLDLPKMSSTLAVVEISRMNFGGKN